MSLNNANVDKKSRNRLFSQRFNLETLTRLTLFRFLSPLSKKQLIFMPNNDNICEYVKTLLIRGGEPMSRKCQISGKGPMSGNTRSHALNSSRRKWNVNLQKATILVDGKPTTVRISARELRTLRKSA